MLDRNSPEIAAFLDAFLHSDSLEEIIKHASAVVRNPVAILDSGYNFLAWSHYESVPDETWLKRIKEGHWDYDFVAMVKRYTATPASRRSVIVTDISPLRRKIDTLISHGELIGYSVVLELGHNLEEVDEEVYSFVRDILIKTVEREKGGRMRPEQKSGTGVMLRDLLHTRFPNKILFQERVKGSVFDRKTVFQLFSLSMDRYSPPVARKVNLEADIARILPDSWSFVGKEYIVILVDLTATLKKNANALDSFASFLDCKGLVAGQSTPFDDLYRLPEQKKQTVRALEIAAELRPFFLIPEKSVLIPYESCKIMDLLTHVPADELPTFCHSDIRAIAEYDTEHSTDYLRTVYEYLKAARSGHAAAQGLHIHHNTVYYRMTKARELFNLDFSLEHRNFHYYLSCIILLYLA